MHNPAWYRMLKGFLWTYLHTFLKLEYWTETDVPDGPKVLVVNHPTVWDAFPILVWREKGFVHVTVEDQIWSYTVPRMIFAAGNQIKLYMAPGKGKSAMLDSLQVLGMRNSHSVLFSIEGGQTLPERRKEIRARRGAILLAMEANCPIIPIGVHIPRRNIIRKEFSYDYGGKKYTDISAVPRFRSPYGVLVGKPWYPMQALTPSSSKEDYQDYADKLLVEVYRLADDAQGRMREGRAGFRFLK